jgi:hypothetical protein
MGWWSEFTGKAGAQRAAEAARAGNQYLDQGYGQAQGYFDQTIKDQLAALNAGYAGAKGGLTAAEATAAGQLNAGADAARTDINTNYDKAQGNVTDYYNRTEGMLNPYLERGSALAGLYGVALGANGAGDQKAFYQEYAANDPFRQFRDEQANREIQSQFNAQGQSGSGRFTTAVSRASLERGTTDLNNYLDRLKGAGEQGAAVAGQLGNIASNTGQTLAGINTRRGDQLSGIETGRGSALANNSSNFGMTRANFDVNQGRDIAGAQGSYGNASAGLSTVLAQAKAGNMIGSANAQNASMKGGLNNLFGLGATVISGFAPGIGGMGAFGNMAATAKNFWK